MKMLRPILMGLLLFAFSYSSAQIDSVLISNAQFKDSKFNNAHAGSGFLLSHEGKVYACTAKHVLFFAKTDSMKTISFGDELELWSFMSKRNKSLSIKAGKLINVDPNEPLAMPPVGDWLIFEVAAEVPDGVAIYEVRKEPLSQNEEVFFLGYPYKSEAPVRIKGKFIGLTSVNNLSLDVPKGTYNGCSGGPVVDKEGKLVGLVSMGYFNQKENKMIFEPASVSYFLEVIKKKS
ncbi:trypsin-like peptidase domain-containing protein [Fulvivirga lutimaris]|uniref:trypsin-like peptidase domain-containing protein n=1 Tax=Fulvivirga lutimaris TaxID=1819566 RepID=UPI0012BC8661|nr:trypsin-like peptidase domain-containing protein [Fulvivirga lutimaris]MTI40831.1 hypothetical protein [Fulvivirga lutimaris]